MSAAKIAATERAPACFYVQRANHTMIDFRNILFPVSMSDQDHRTAPYVQAMARRFRSTVVMLHVQEFAAEAYAPADLLTPAILEFTQEVNQTRRKQFESFLAAEFEGIPLQRVVAEGDPAHEIAACAKTRDIGLVMMPTHGYGRFRRFLLGSITAKVLHDVNCPVWTSVHTPEISSANADGCGRLLCAVDIDAREVRVIRWAAEFAETNHCELQLVHAIPGAWSTDTEKGPPFGEFLFRLAKEELERLQKQAGTSLPAVIRGGKPERVLHQAAEELKPDLIICGRGDLNHPLGRLHTHVYSIIRESPCPVISV